MANSTLALIFVVLVNILIWFSQLAMIDLAGDDATNFYNCEGTMIDDFGDCEDYTFNSEVEDNLPGSEGTVNPSEGNIFTDIFNNILSWFKTAPGIRYLYAMVTAPYSLLVAIGLPTEICFGLGMLWYIISLFVVVSFLWGRE